MKKIHTKISKWGNGYGIRIPIHMIGELSLTNGSAVYLVTDGNKIVVEPEQAKADVRHKSLKEIYKGFKNTKEKDADSYFKSAQGREIW